MEDSIQTVDLVNAAQKFSLVIMFGKSPSRYYRLAVNIAQSSILYKVIKLGPDIFHICAFEKTRDDVARAASLLSYVSQWKTTQVYGGGQILLDIYKMEFVLRCYLKASACTDWKAHCYTIIDDPYFDRRAYNDEDLTIRITSSPLRTWQEVIVDEYIFPCKMLLSYFSQKSDKHPSDPVNQVQARAIDIGCDWCPFFDAKAYRKVGHRKKAIY